MKQRKKIMSIKTVVTAAALVLTAGVASAQAINPGVQQLASQLGVDGSGYTATQLIQLADAKRDNDTERFNYILSNSDVGSVSDAQTAGTLGLSSGQFTAVELSQLNEARRDNDTTTINFILSGANRAAPADNLEGKQQLAALVGVNANDYTLAQLIALQPDFND
jgi:hypothetical protein